MELSVVFVDPIILLFWLSREGAESRYFFSTLALTLNELEEGVAPTDSRRRPDQRLMEDGRWDEANAEKQRLEEKQRTVRREREREAVKAVCSPEEGRKRKMAAWVCLVLSNVYLSIHLLSTLSVLVYFVCLSLSQP